MTESIKCEICETENATEVLYKMNLCKSCANTERAASESAKTAMEDRKLEQEQKYNQSLQVRTDVFNSEAASITELKQIIDNDDRIENKNYKLCEVVQEKIIQLKKVIFEENERLIELNNRLRANQQYLIEQANKLRSEERAKLQLQDVNYKPNVVKISKPKLVSVKKKIDKAKVKELIVQLNTEFPALQLAESTFYMIMTAKGRGPEDTYYDLRKSLKEGMSAKEN